MFSSHFRGTPPRMWGKPINYVGDPIPGTGTPPRMWGKLVYYDVPAGSYEGTPPRMWGKQTDIALPRCPR